MVSLNNKTGIDENQATNKGKDEVEISCFFYNSVVSHYVFSGSCHVREHACDVVLLKTDTSEGT